MIYYKKNNTWFSKIWTEILETQNLSKDTKTRIMIWKHPWMRLLRIMPDKQKTIIDSQLIIHRKRIQSIGTMLILKLTLDWPLWQTVQLKSPLELTTQTNFFTTTNGQTFIKEIQVECIGMSVYNNTRANESSNVLSLLKYTKSYADSWARPIILPWQINRNCRTAPRTSIV